MNRSRRWINDTNEEVCKKFQLDSRIVSSLARQLSYLGRKAQAAGLLIFGGSTGGSLRPINHPGAQNVVATLDGAFDGGDGGDGF